MRIIQHGRGGGKTTRIVQAFRDHGSGYLLVASFPERDRIIRQYRFTPQEFDRTLVAHGNVLKGVHGEVFCDNLDWVVSMFLGAAVDVATVNGPMEPPPASDAVDSSASDSGKLSTRDA